MEQDGKRKRRSFTAEYKAEAVGLVEQSGKSIGVIARELGLGDTALRRWVEQAQVDAGRGAPGKLTSSEREELAQLRRENKRLRMEREILKNCRVPRAASALPAGRETLQAATVGSSLGAMAVRFLVTSLTR